MKHRLSPLALALLVSYPADALLLQQGDAQFELDPATLRIAAGAVPVNLAQPAQQVEDPPRRHNAPVGAGRRARSRLAPVWKAAICA